MQPTVEPQSADSDNHTSCYLKAALHATNTRTHQASCYLKDAIHVMPPIVDNISYAHNGDHMMV